MVDSGLSIRKEQDFYPTPEYTIKSLLDNFDFSNYGINVLEPGAGAGNICRMFKYLYPNKELTVNELREEELDTLSTISDYTIMDNFLNCDFKGKTYDIIIGNPPYSLGLQFIQKSISLLSEKGVLVFLLRTAFLESKRRYRFWQLHPITGLMVLSRRPSFTGKGTDATSYSWFVWDKTSNSQFIKVI